MRLYSALLWTFEAIRCAAVAACRRKTREVSLIKDWNSLQRDFIRKTVNETTWNKKQRLSYKRKFKKYFLYPEKKYPHKSSCDLLLKIKATALEGGKMLEERK